MIEVNNINRYFNYRSIHCDLPIVFTNLQNWQNVRNDEYWLKSVKKRIWLLEQSQSHNLEILVTVSVFRKSEQRSFRFFSNAKLQDPRFQTDSSPVLSFPRFHENQLFRLGVILAIIEANGAVSQLLPAITRNDKVRQFSPGFPKCPVPASVLPIAAALPLVSRGEGEGQVSNGHNAAPLNW